MDHPHVWPHPTTLYNQSPPFPWRMPLRWWRVVEGGGEGRCWRQVVEAGGGRAWLNGGAEEQPSSQPKPTSHLQPNLTLNSSPTHR